MTVDELIAKLMLYDTDLEVKIREPEGESVHQVMLVKSSEDEIHDVVVLA